jgi:branched-chain amino acid transport system substrate-binding protein
MVRFTPILSHQRKREITNLSSWQFKREMRKEDEMKLKKYYFLLIVAVSVLILNGFLVSSVLPQERRPIKIGITFDLSGPLASDGEAELPAVKMFFEEKAMKVAGRKIELIVEDSAASPNIALSKTKKLTEMDKIHLLIIGQDSASGYAVRDYVHQNRVPTLALALGAAHTRARYSPYFFRISPCTYQYSYGPAKWWCKYGFKKIIFLANDFAPAREVYEAFKRGLEEMGGQVVQVVWVPVGCLDFAPYIPELKVAQADAVVAVVWGVAGVRFFKQWAEYGKKGTIPVVGIGTTIDEDVKLPAMGLDVEGSFSSSFTCPTADVPENKKFTNRYKGRTGKLPSAFAYIAYMASEIAYQAMDRVNGEVENKDKLLKALKNVKFTTPMGAKAYFDERNGMAWDMIFMQARRADGEVHLYEIGRLKNVKDPIEVFP